MSSNNLECVVFNMGDVTYVIPDELLDKFESTPYDDREKKFRQYILEDGETLEVSVSHLDFENFLETW